MKAFYYPSHLTLMDKEECCTCKHTAISLPYIAWHMHC